MQNGTISIRAEDDVAELLRLHKTSLRPHRVRKLLSFRDGFSADLPRWIHVVLRLNSRNHFGRGNTEFRQLIRVHPDPQRILATKDLNTRHAFHTCDLILKIDDGVVGQKVLAKFIAWRVDGD